VPEITTVGNGVSVMRIVVEGDVVDPPHSSALYDAICGAMTCRAVTVEVDLSEVVLFGSVGINSLIQARQHAARVGCEVTVVGASPFVRRVFEITGLTDVFGMDEG
jgi:anti-anti-sigma factor